MHRETLAFLVLWATSVAAKPVAHRSGFPYPHPFPTPSAPTGSEAASLTYAVVSGSSVEILTVVVTQTITDITTDTIWIEGSSESTQPSSPSLTAEYSSSSPPPITSNTVSQSSLSPASSTTLPTSTPSTSLSIVSPPPASSPASSLSLSTTPANASVCSSTAAAPAATQAGIIAGCTEWYIAVSGDYCYIVAENFSISVDTFMSWNPAVDPPNCPDMIAGDAYCVAICGSSTSTGSATTVPSRTISGYITTITAARTTISTTVSSMSSVPSATSTVDVYRMYTGDGSVADGWPAQAAWVDWDYMFEANTPNMQAACAQWGVPDDSDQEVANMKTAIAAISDTTGVDSRFILAIIMQESTGCVRVITTQYSVFNPGLMQSHNGTGTCNTNSAAIDLPGVEATGVVQTPCPYSEIYQQIEDGTNGTAAGDGLVQLLVEQGHSDVSRFYRAARMYNGGSIDPSGDLGKGCCTFCYVSDIANRLTGWVDAPRSCTL